MRVAPKLIVIAAALMAVAFGTTRADAEVITWHWAGPVTGYTHVELGATLDEVLPLGTRVDLFLTLDPVAPYLNQSSCLQGMSSASLQLLGRTYTNTGYVWVDAMGFGPGVCWPGSNQVEVVVPSWGFGGPPLPDGWELFGLGLPGMWWSGDLSEVQPASIGTQFPMFYRPRQATPQSFRADLRAVENIEAVPEPSSLLLFSTGLSAAAWWRRRNREA